MTARPIFAFLSLFFTAGAILLVFLTLLAGATNHSPVNLIYFLQADTAGIPNAPALSRWTFWNICSVNAKGRDVCGKVHPAFPFDPPSHRNFGTTVNIPPAFIGTHKYFYLTRFMFAFVLIGLFFAVCSLFTGLLALCSRIGAFLSAFLNMLALFFQTLTAALMTAAYVLGRDHFKKHGQSARLGRYAFGFMWAAVACLFLSTLLFCIGGAASRKDAGYGTTRRSRFGRRTKSTKSRGSFIDRKEEYSSA